MKIYKYVSATEHEADKIDEKHYSNLTKLCNAEGLNYTNVYNSIVRNKKGVWTDASVSVTLINVI